MKKAISILGIIAAAVICSCMRTQPAFDTISDSETVHWKDKRFDLDYRFEYLSDYRDKDVLQKIQRSMSVDFFGEDYLRDTPAATAEYFRESSLGDYRESVSDEHSWDGFIKIRSHADLLAGRIVVYTVESATYMGGAHGMETTDYSNYDLRTGERLTLGDLFTPEGKAALPEIIRERILDNLGYPNWGTLMDSTCYYAAAEIRPTENFKLSESHITFMYNPYEIACYAQGHTEVKLSLDRLDGFRKEAIAR